MNDEEFSAYLDACARIQRTQQDMATAWKRIHNFVNGINIVLMTLFVIGASTTYFLFRMR